MKVNIFFIQNTKIIAIIRLEKFLLNAGIFNIIVYKLSYWQELYLIILVKIEKDSKIYFYYSILILDLAINF